MGLFGKLISSLGRSEELCPTCGGPLEQGGRAEGVFWCAACDRIVRPGDPDDGAPSGRTCAACGASLDDGDHYAPYEDGRNAYAYITCRCGFENIQYGFGEDD